MQTRNYKTSLTIDGPVEAVFLAISQKLGDWWGEQDSIIDRDKIDFKVSWGEPWYRFKVISFHPDEEMSWECIDANQKIPGLEGVEKEWVGTRIHWKLTATGPRQTRLEFEHEGLVPEFICFNFCSQSWEHFLGKSLKNYIGSSNA